MRIVALLIAGLLMSGATSANDARSGWLGAIESQKYDEAEADLRGRLQALTGEERNACLFALGFVLARSGKTGEARATFSKIDPASPWTEEARFVQQTFSRIAPPATLRAGGGLGPPVPIVLKKGTTIAIGHDRYARSGNTIRLNGRPVSSPHDLPENTAVDGRTYRGKLQIVSENGLLALLNTVPMEEYLYGVLKNEVGPSWPPEALKAQAIASRTYVLRRIEQAKSSRNGPARLASDVSIQVYRGRNAEDPRILAVVDATRGMVLMHGLEIVESVFHSESGGVTESAADLWGRRVPYLMSQTDPYGGTSPKNEWTAEFDERELLRALDKQTRSKVGRLRAIHIAEKTASGRAKVLRMVGSRGRALIAAGKYRLALGADRLRSLLWDEFEYAKGRLRVKGRGWGHGVGMSQWSAKAAAERGLGCMEILQVYFPGTQVEVRY